MEALYHETFSRSDCSTSQNADTDVSEEHLDSKSIDNVSGKKAEVKAVEAVEAVQEAEDEEVSDVDEDHNGGSTQQHASFTKLAKYGNGIRIPTAGDYLMVQVYRCNGQVLYVNPILISSLADYYRYIEPKFLSLSSSNVLKAS